MLDFKNMEEQRKFTRKQFLAVLGSLALTVVVAKVAGTASKLTAITNQKRSGGYGSSVYGGGRNA